MNYTIKKNEETGNQVKVSTFNVKVGHCICNTMYDSTFYSL